MGNSIVSLSSRIKIFLSTSFLTLGWMASVDLARSDSIKQVALYQPSAENFANPERGLFIQYNPQSNSPHPPLELKELQQYREENITLIRRIYLISEYRDRPFSPEFLDKVTTDLATARSAGVKVILRFSYNWLHGGEDASEAIILAQQKQLQPILEANYDVIAHLEAGFIGHWGEWHSSSHGLDTDPQARKNILDNLLKILPKERMVTLRYAHHKRDAFNNQTPLKSLAASGVDRRARVGALNDCFLASIDDWGTYNSTAASEVNQQKAFLEQDNLYVVQAGELCNYNPPRTNCPTALVELEQMRWSALNYYLPETELNVIFQDWEQQGCLEEITRRLGYRFSLTRSELNQQAIAQGIFELNLDLVNNGWASLYNPRQLEIIIRHRSTGKEYSIISSANPRRWLPDSQHRIKIEADLPDDLPPGDYQLFLNLPDSHPRLADRPEFSIRLANLDLWEKNTGYNYLKHIMTIPEPSLQHNRPIFRPRQAGAKP